MPAQSSGHGTRNLYPACADIRGAHFIPRPALQLHVSTSQSGSTWRTTLRGWCHPVPSPLPVGAVMASEVLHNRDNIIPPEEVQPREGIRIYSHSTLFYW